MKGSEIRYFHVEKYTAWFSNDAIVWVKGRLQGVEGLRKHSWISNDGNNYKFIKFN